MFDQQSFVTIMIFSFTILIMVWKSGKLSETVPTVIGAILFLLIGVVPLTDLVDIFNLVSGPAITILSSIIMSIVLESIGFFNWVAYNLVNKAKGSGIRLFIYINLLCYLMTLFFNNDGSILITTPIIIKTVNMLNLKRNQKIAFLLPGAITATTSSAPIAISNIANLIALNIIGLDLNGYVSLMFIPSMLGILTTVTLLFLYFKKDIPKKLPDLRLTLRNYEKYSFPHPLSNKEDGAQVDWTMFKICMLIIVLTRGAFFLLSPLGVPLEVIAIIGAVLLVGVRWYKKRTGLKDIFFRTPWHILLFAFSMYILVYGLQNIGLTKVLVEHMTGIVHENRLYAIFTMGGLLTILSNLFNNLPAVMIGTLTLTEMGLDHNTLQVTYLANILGSDIGALLTPAGTLATLLWMFILKEHGIFLSWMSYIKAALVSVPIGLVVSLFSLYLWSNWVFG
jgi:arsenical pump membrane protein